MRLVLFVVSEQSCHLGHDVAFLLGGDVQQDYPSLSGVQVEGLPVYWFVAFVPEKTEDVSFYLFDVANWYW